MGKKVAFITRHAVSNYGSVLQAYALQTAIEGLGHEAVCIDYIPADETPDQIADTLLEDSRWNKNAATRAAYKLTQRPVFKSASSKFEAYRGGLLKLSKKSYHDGQSLKDDLPEADVFMTGSDQVWNTIHHNKIDPVYFLSFTDGVRKTAYAASFGSDSVIEENKEAITKYIKDYDQITIREKNGVEACKRLGVKAEQVLDPTLLLDKSDWERIIPEGQSKQKYVLVYQLHPNKQFQTYAKQFAKNKGLKLVRVHPYFHHVVKPGKFVNCPPIGEFLRLINDAEYLLTDSFHATAFAIGLNTDFVDVLPNLYSERISSVLGLVGLENRVLKSYSDFSAADQKIDFAKVNSMIKDERERSIQLLKQLIEG